MEDTLIKKIDFIGCRGAAASIGRILEFQFDTEVDREHDMWYVIQNDFEATEWAVATEVETEDDTISGTKRTGQKAVSFGQTLSATLSDDTNANFLTRLYEQTTYGDDHFFSLLNEGLNVRITQMFGNGIKLTKTHYCNTITSLEGLLDQIKNQDSEVTLELALNKEPIIDQVGFSGGLPKGVTDLSADITVSTTDDGLTVSITNVKDPSKLAISPMPATEKFAITVYNEETNLIEVQTKSDGTADAEITVPVGKYTVVISYAIAEKDGKITYRNFAQKRVEKI